jgi:hypothetical protein
MDNRFQSFIEAAVQQAKQAQSMLWADEIAERIAASTPLKVRASDISVQITRAAARAGVAVTVAESRRAAKADRKREACACTAA